MRTLKELVDTKIKIVDDSKVIIVKIGNQINEVSVSN